MRVFLFTLLFGSCCFGTGALAQDYGSAIGVRLGSPISASYKTFFGGTTALELMVGIESGTYLDFIDWQRTNAGGLLEFHRPIEGVDGLSYYFGPGASVLLLSFPEFSESYLQLGIHGVGGLSYTFDNAPLNLSIDWVPTYVLTLDSELGDEGAFGGFDAGFGALSVRYVIGRD